MSSEQDGIVVLTLSPEADPAAAAREFIGQEGLQGGRVSTGRINGNPAAAADFEVPREGAEDIRGRVAFVRYRDVTYRLLGYTTEARWSSYQRPIGRFIESFDRLTDRQALNVQPARVDLVRPRSELSLDRFAQQYPSTVPIETVALINHLTTGASFAPGLDAKRIVGGIGQ